MQIVAGKAVSSGIARGQIWCYRPAKSQVSPETIDSPRQELAKLERACSTALIQLQALEDKVRAETGEETAQLFAAHQLMLLDDDFQQEIREAIGEQKLSAAWAVEQAGELFANQLAAMDDAYFQARAADVRDVAGRLVAILCGHQACGLQQPDGEAILLADDLTPSETVQLDRQRIAGIVTRQGSANSHTAILARAMGIPALVGLELAELPSAWDGLEAVIDGNRGRICLTPDGETRQRYKEELEQQARRRETLLAAKDEPAITRCGRRIALYANIGSAQELATALDNGAEGIGLFRSEFLYLGREDLPGEEEQFAAYRAVAEGMNGKRVIIRTLDLGADKQTAALRLAKEDNPALGCRAIRLCLSQPELLITQLRAILRASAWGRIAIMFPMVASLWEVRALKALYQQCRQQLDAEGIPYRADIELGIMIETPAAALTGDLLAPEVDFFSIGTNDLTQYTLAVDRQNQALAPYGDPTHPALLRLIEQVCAHAYQHGVWVGVCGELAADLALSEYFIRLGVAELSVSPPALLPLKKAIQQIILK